MEATRTVTMNTMQEQNTNMAEFPVQGQILCILHMKKIRNTENRRKVTGYAYEGAFHLAFLDQYDSALLEDLVQHYAKRSCLVTYVDPRMTSREVIQILRQSTVYTRRQYRECRKESWRLINSLGKVQLFRKKPA